MWVKCEICGKGFDNYPALVAHLYGHIRKTDKKTSKALAELKKAGYGEGWMSTVEEIDKEIKKIESEIQELEKRKLELLVKEGKAYKCKDCGDIVRKLPGLRTESEKEGLCHACWSKKVRRERREKLLQMFGEARIVDIKPRANPFSDMFEVDSITLEVDGKRYELTADGWDERYIEISEVRE